MVLTNCSCSLSCLGFVRIRIYQFWSPNDSLDRAIDIHRFYRHRKLRRVQKFDRLHDCSVRTVCCFGDWRERLCKGLSSWCCGPLLDPFLQQRAARREMASYIPNSYPWLSGGANRDPDLYLLLEREDIASQKSVRHGIGESSSS